MSDEWLKKARIAWLPAPLDSFVPHCHFLAAAHCCCSPTPTQQRQEGEGSQEAVVFGRQEEANTMSSTLGTLFYVILLLVNAVAILNEERFLARVGWTTSHVNQASFESSGFSAPGQDAGVKARMVNLISAVRMLLRVPLIVFNIVVITYELLLG